MAENLQWLDFFDHTGGKNTRNTITTTPVFDATDQLNVENLVKGGFRKINGYERYSQCPILASGTKAGGTLDLDGESDAWTGEGDATTFSTTGGIGTIDEGAGASAHQTYYNAEAGFTTGTDAAYETRLKIRSGGTLSGVYALTIGALDDGTDRFELVAIETGGTKQVAVLTNTSDRTVIGSYDSAYRVDHNWTEFTRYRISYDASGNVSVYIDDMVTAAITIAVSALPASTETSRVRIGSSSTSTVVVWDFDYIVYKIGSVSLDTAPITGIYSFVDEADTEEVLATAGTALYSFSTTTNDWVAITGGTAFTSGAKPHFVTFNDTGASNAAIAIITTESRNTVQKYGGGGTKADLAGSPPAGKYLAIYNERLFIANTATEPSAVFYSALGDPEDRDSGSGTWDTTNDVFLVDRHKHGQITGLVTVNNFLLVFSQRAVHRLQGWGKGSFLLEEVSVRNGCIAPNSLVVGNFGKFREGVYFRDRDGFYWTDGQIGNVVRVSEKILTEIEEDFNTSLANNEAGVIDQKRNLVLWGVTKGSDLTNSQIYAFDYINGGKQGPDGELIEGWFPYDIALRAAAVVRSSSSRDRVLFSDHAGVVYVLNSGTTFDEADYEGYRTTAWIRPQSFSDCQFRYLVLYTKASGDHNLEISWGINYQDDFTDMDDVNLAANTDLLGSTFTLGTSVLGTVGVIYKRIRLDVVAKAIRFRYRTASKDEPFTILGFSVGFAPQTYFDSNA